ncbi:autotransporter adhesin, partial [Actinobacillus minor 202]
MNQIFRVIWNQSTQTWVAVSELAKGRVKSSTTSEVSVEVNRSDKSLWSIGTLSVLLGLSANAWGAYTGDGGSATGLNSIAIGVGSTATQLNAIAIGRGASAAIYRDTTAVGSNSTASGYLSSAYGFNSTSSGETSVALGTEAKASGAQGVALGSSVNASGPQSTAIGNNANASGYGSIVIGGDDIGTATSYTVAGKTFTIEGNGNSAYVSPTASGHAAVVVGSLAKATGNFSSAYGSNALAVAEGATALGTFSNASGIGSFAGGVNSTSSGNSSTALGINSSAVADFTTAIGVDAKASGANATSIGANATASGGQAIATGLNAQATKGQTIAIGMNATATGDRAIATGLNAAASEQNSIATGFNSKALSDSSIAIGHATTSGKQVLNADGTVNSTLSSTSTVAIGNGVNATGKFSMAFGSYSNATGARAITIGSSSSANATSAVSIGAQSKANTNYSTAIGPSANASTAENSTAIGANANATLAGSVALGNNSITGTSVPATTLSYNFANDAGSTVAASAQKDKADSVVSVGNGTYQRKIINLAAGAVTATSTEAINGSQLYNVVTNVGFNIQENGTAKSRINNNNIINFANGTYTTASVTDGANSSKVVFNVVNQAITSANGVAAVSGTTAGLATAADVVNAVNNTGFNLQANGATNSFVKSGDTVNFKQGDNILVTKSGNNITVATSMTPTFTMLTTTGDATIGGNLDMTNGKITNLANGTNPTDAVNLQQLNATAALANRPLTFAGNTGTTEQQLGSTLNISGNASTAGNYSSANVKTVVTQDKVEIQIAESPTFTSVETGSLNATGDVNVDGALTTRGGIIVDGVQTVDMGGNQINNVDAGTSDTDAVNLAQLKANTTKVVAGKNTTVTNTTGADGTTYTINADDTSASVSTDSSLLTVAANGSKTVGNATVTDYKVSLSQGTLATNNGVVSSTTNGVATTQDVANAINKGYWKVGNNAGTETAQIKFGDQVNFVNGSGTLSNVIGSNVSFDVNVDGKTINVGSDGKLTVNTSALPKGVSVEAGNHTTVTSSAGTNGETVYTVDAEKTTASAGSNALAVTAGAKDANGVTDYAIDLSQTTKEQLEKADTALQNFTTSVNGATVETITKDNNDVGFVNGTGTTARNDNGNITFDIKTTNLTTT